MLTLILKLLIRLRSLWGQLSWPQLQGLNVLILSFITLSGCDLFNKNKTSEIKSPFQSWVMIDGSKDLEDRFVPQVLNGKTIILNFWASWCGPCQQEMPSLLKLVADHSDQLVLISINVDNSEKEMKKFMGLFPNFKGSNIFVFYDGERKWVQSYAVTGFPETFLYNKQHQFIKRHQGALDFKNVDFLSGTL